MKVHNRTPHEVVVLDDQGQALARFAPDGPPIRLSTKVASIQPSADVKGFPLSLVVYGAAEDAPVRDEENIYIVSLPTALAANRDDFLVPFDEVRDEFGRIIGCRGLAFVVTP
jgi:hypothetical protein